MYSIEGLVRSVVRSVIPSSLTRWAISQVAESILPKLTPFGIPGSRVLTELRSLGGHERTQTFYQDWNKAKVSYEVVEKQEPWFRDPATKEEFGYEYRANLYSITPAGERVRSQDVPLWSDRPLSKQEIADRLYEEWEEGEGRAGEVAGSVGASLYRVVITGGAIRTDIGGVRSPV